MSARQHRGCGRRPGVLAVGQPAVPAGRLVRSPRGALTSGKDKKAKGRCGQEVRERWGLGWPLGGGEDQLAALPGSHSWLHPDMWRETGGLELQTAGRWPGRASRP